MYKEFYGFTKKPFSKTPDPEFLYLSKSHQESLSRLQYAVEEKELMLLTGEIGSGKTTLSRALLDQLDESYKIIMITNPVLSPSQFLRLIAKGLGIDLIKHFRVDVLEQINLKLYSMYEEDISPVVIIDEAQLIPSRETFEEIRLLTNFQLDDENLITIILIAQPEIIKRLKHKVYEPLTQRIGLRFHLSALTYGEMMEYVHFRMETAGVGKKIFSEDALKKIFEYSKGIPRVANNIAASSLLSGFGKGVKIIDSDIVYDIASELQLVEPDLSRNDRKIYLKK